MKIFKEICNALREGNEVVAATIVGTQGSTPAPSESRMCVIPREQGRTAGTIGGGCLDAEVIAYAGEAWNGVRARLVEIELNDESGDTGLVCGGTVTVLIEALEPSQLPLYERIVAEGEEGRACRLTTTLTREGFAAKQLHNLEGELIAARELPRGASAAEGRVIRELIEPDPTVIVFGGGHLGKAVSQCAAIAGFRVTVIDDRKAYANKQRFPEASRVLCESFEESFKRITISRGAYVVIVTRGHRSDELVLENVLRSAPAYIGMIGSKRKVRFTYDRLEQKGISRELLGRVHAPIGLPIGAKTPGEIAVSIVAELVAKRRNR